MLMTLLAPLLTSFLSPKPRLKIHFVISAIIVVGIVWLSVGLYYHLTSSIIEAYAAAMCGVACIGLAALTMIISCIVKSKMEKKIVSSTMQTVNPVIDEVYSFLSKSKVKMLVPLFALAFGFNSIKRK